MGRQHVRDGKISAAQQKTGTRLWVPLHPDLRAILNATPSNDLTFLISGHSKPYASAKSLGNAVNAWAKQAGLTDCPLHGLRKACCRRLAEAGCTTQEIMAISGHKSLAEVSNYTKAADQERMAATAMEKIQGTKSYPREDQSYPQEKKA